jgi:hypothetical protein
LPRSPPSPSSGPQAAPEPRRSTSSLREGARSTPTRSTRPSRSSSERDPNDAAALAWLGSARVRKARTASVFTAPGWVKKGFNTLDEAVERFPDAFVVYMVRGTTALRVPDFFKKTPVAISDLSAVVAMKERSPAAVPDSVMPSVYLNLGLAYKKNGQTAEARATWERGTRLYPSAPEAGAIAKELRSL